MPSHYSEIIVEDNFEKVFKVLYGFFCNIFYFGFKKDDGNRVGIIVGEKYYFRVNSDVGLFILVEELNDLKNRVIVISYAGGAGLLRVSYHAHSNYVNQVLEVLAKKGIRYERVREIHYFRLEKLPSDLKDYIEKMIGLVV